MAVSSPAPASNQELRGDPETITGDTGEEAGDWRRRQSSSHSQHTTASSSISVREEVLAEKEVHLSELESLVRAAEMKAELVRKEKDLSEWERNIRLRKLECKRRLAKASKILTEGRHSDTGRTSSPRSLISPVPSLGSSSTGRAVSLCSPPAEPCDPGPPSQHSTPRPPRLQPPTLQMFGPPRVLPSTAKLPPSAIKLNSSHLALLNSTPGPSTRLSYPSEDTPMNLSKPKPSATCSTTEEMMLAGHNLSSDSSSDVPPLSEPVSLKNSEKPGPSNIIPFTPVSIASSQENINLPCVDIPKDKVFELSVKVVDDGHSSIEAGDAVNITYPLPENLGASYILGDNIDIHNLDVVLQNSGSSEESQTYVAEIGDNGQITLVPTAEKDVVNIADTRGVEQMESELQCIRENMEAINESPGDGSVAGPSDDNGDSQAPENENNNGCDVVNYFENRIRDFEYEIIKGDYTKIGSNEIKLHEKEITTNEPLSECTINTQSKSKNQSGKRISEETISSPSKRKKEDYEKTKEKDKLNDVRSIASISGRRSSRIKNSSTDEENDSSTPDEVNANSVDDAKAVPVASVEEKKNNELLFNCGRCKSVVKSERSWRRHRDTVHGGSARLQNHPEGQHFDEDQESLAWKHALAAFKKINCPRCNKVTFVKSHILEEHLKTCNIHRSIDVKSTKLCVNDDKSKDEKKSAAANEGDVGGGRNRRKAATKARSTVAAFVQAMKTKFDGESSEGEPDANEILEDSDDNFTVQNAFDISKFYKQVKIGRKASFVCLICDRSFKKKAEVEQHILSDHKDKIAEEEEEEDEMDGDSEESSEPATDDEDADDMDSEYSGTLKKKKKESSHSIQRRLILEPCPELLSLEDTFRKKCYIEDSFSDIKITLSSWVKSTDAKYIPPGCKSVQFSVPNDSDSSSKDKEFISLNRFEGSVVNKSPIMYCGGPVTAVAWCSNSPRVLAVVTKLTFAPSTLGDTSPGPGLVQLWRAAAGAEEDSPELLFSLCHDYGTVWDLEWAPSGGPGLGLLAAACGDGSVRVWAVPSPEQLGGRGAVFAKSADLSLVAGEPCGEAGQCLALSWYRGPGHGYLASCHASGLVNLWHVATTSALLRPSPGTLLPVQTWLAHHGSVTGVSLCPGTEPHPAYAVTGGTDRCYKFWDLRDTSVPIQEVKRGMVSDVKWISGWSGAGVAYDDVYLQGHTQSLLAETGYYSTRSHPVISQDSSVTRMTLSQWLGCMAVCTSAGELIIFVMPSLDRSLEHDKNLAQRRCYVYRTEVVPSLSPPPDHADRRQYETAAAGSRLVYHDTDLRPAAEDVRRVRVADLMDSEDLTSFPLAGLTSVAWNNGLSHLRLLASGGQAGIVRVHDLKALNTASIQQVMPST